MIISNDRVEFTLILKSGIIKLIKEIHEAYYGDITEDVY